MSENNTRRRGRQDTKVPRGEAHHSARLCAADVLRMRERHAAGESLKSIADDYPQCSKPAVHHILSGRNWRHLLPAPVIA